MLCKPIYVYERNTVTADKIFSKSVKNMANSSLSGCAQYSF